MVGLTHERSSHDCYLFVFRGQRVDKKFNNAAALLELTESLSISENNFESHDSDLFVLIPDSLENPFLEVELNELQIEDLKKLREKLF